MISGHCRSKEIESHFLLSRQSSTKETHNSLQTEDGSRISPTSRAVLIFMYNPFLAPGANGKFLLMAVRRYAGGLMARNCSTLPLMGGLRQFQSDSTRAAVASK